MSSDRLEWANLSASEPEDQERAALTLYDTAGPSEELGRQGSAALRSSVSRGNHSAAALLLLGRDPSDEARSILRRVRGESAGERTKLRAWTPVVDVSLPAMVALSRAGDSDARLALLAHIERAAVDDFIFLLDVAREIDDPALLHALGRGLDDETLVASGVPSGARPQRRLADLTVDALIERLNLSVAFESRPSGRYSNEEIQQVKRALSGAIPH